MYYTYGHIRPDTGVVFNVGKGSKRRAYSKSKRNDHWHNVVNKNDGKFDVIIFNWFNNEDDALHAEIWQIAELKHLGHLVNKTDGGDGLKNPSKETRDKISAGQKEYHKNNPDKNPMKIPEIAAKFKGENNPSKRPEVILKRSLKSKSLGNSHHTKRPEVRAKNSASLKAWHAANPEKNPSKRDDVKAKKSVAMKGDNNPMKRPDLREKRTGRNHHGYGKPNLGSAFANLIRQIPYWGA